MSEIRAAAIRAAYDRTPDQRKAARRLAFDIVECLLSGSPMPAHVAGLSAREVMYSLAAEIVQYDDARERLTRIVDPPPRLKTMPPWSMAEGKQHLAAGLRFALLTIDGVPEGEALDRC